jgi:hypothetical protein
VIATFTGIFTLTINFHNRGVYHAIAVFVPHRMPSIHIARHAYAPISNMLEKQGNCRHAAFVPYVADSPPTRDTLGFVDQDSLRINFLLPDKNQTSNVKHERGDTHMFEDI